MHKLSQVVLKKINTPETRRKLMDELGCTEFTISRYIQKNSEQLTLYGSLKIISKITGLSHAELVGDKPAPITELHN